MLALILTRPEPFLLRFGLGFCLRALGMILYYGIILLRQLLNCSFFYCPVLFRRTYPSPTPTTMKSTKPSARSPKPRSPENTSTSFSVSRKLLEEARQWAKEEKRPLSNLIAVILEREILERKRQREQG